MRLAFAIAFVFSCLCNQVLAAPPPPTSQLATPITAGQPAPFEGLLLPPASALALAQRVQGCEGSMAALKTQGEELLKIEEGHGAALQAQANQQRSLMLRCDNLLTGCQQELRKTTAGYGPWLWFPLGFVAGAGVSMGMLLHFR